MSKDQYHIGPVIQSSVMFFLAILMMMNLVTPFSEERIKFYLSFRMIAIVVLIIVTSNFVQREKKLDHYMTIFGTLLLMLVVVFVLDQKYYPHLFTGFLLLAIGYLSFNGLVNEVKNQENLKTFVYYFIIGGLFYDLTMAVFGLKSFELSFVIPAIGIGMIYFNRYIHRIGLKNEAILQKDQLIKENLRLEREIQRITTSAETVKGEYSDKFMKKQQYFENIEIAVEVLKGSLLIINDNFKVEYAHGEILEESDFEDMTGLDVSKAIFDLATDEGQYFKSVVKKIFKAVDEVREQLYISLLDSQLNVQNRLYDVTYDVVQKRNGSKVLILHADLVNDYSQEGAILAREKEISTMVITIAKHGEVFFSDLSTYLHYAKHIEAHVLKTGSMREKIFTYLKRLHTFKGVFDQYNMHATVSGLNDVENELLNMLHRADEMTDEVLVQTLKSYHLEGIVQSDISIIKEKLGQSYLDNNKKMSVDVVKYSRLMTKLKDLIGPDHDLVTSFRHLVYVDIKEVLASYKEYILRIAGENSKLVNFTVAGDEIKVRRQTYVHFFESLIHLFKNSVIHGLEYPDERRRLGKEEYGQVQCRVENRNDVMVIQVKDDGKGVDLKEMKNRLFISGRYTMEELENLSDAFISNLILEDGLTTSQPGDLYSGRGVGMSSIKGTVEKLGGQTNVISQEGQGVTYEMILPLEFKAEIKIFDSMTIQKALTLEAEKILTKNERKTQISNNWYLEKTKFVRDDLLEVTAHLTIQGVRDTHICVSADEKMLKHLVDHYGLYGQYKHMSLRTMNEALAVFAAALTRNTVDQMQGSRQAIKITDASLLTRTSFDHQFDQRDGSIARIDIGEGKLTLMVLSAKVRKGD